MKALGIHILVDLYECPAELLNDLEYIEESMKKAAHAAGATIVDANFHRFSPHGITGVLTIQESHLAIHTWPEYGFAAVDLFTCGQSIDPWRAYEVLKEVLHTTRATAVEMHRGQSDMLSIPQQVP
jgi:S-adenosylmethionine decarboxylase proenzyme